jgi:hypothetical protein
MAITTMGGLLVATVLTLLVVPALYAMRFRVMIDEPLEGSIHPNWWIDQAGPFRIAAE